MSGFKHTPEKWKVIKSEMGDTKRIFSGSKYIAIVGNTDDENDITEANATLIAAAPEMLDALIAEYTVLKNIYTAKSMLCGDDVKKVLDAVISVKKHAIERATGMTIEEAIKAYEEDNK